MNTLGLLESPFSMSRPRGFTTWDSVAGPGGATWKHFGPEPLDPGMGALHKAPGRRGILGAGLRGKGPGRTETLRGGAGPGVLKNKHSMHTLENLNSLKYPLRETPGPNTGQ